MTNEKSKILKTSLISFASCSVVFFVFFFVKLGILIPLNAKNQNTPQLALRAPFQFTFEEENISWFSDNPIISTRMAVGLIFSVEKIFSNDQKTIYGLANNLKSPESNQLFNIVPRLANESKIGINRISPTLALLGDEIQHKRIRVITKYLLVLLAIGSLILFVLILMKFGILIPLLREKHRYVSLTVGVPFQLTCEGENVTWHSNNPLVSVNELGVVIASEDIWFPKGQGTIYALSNRSKSKLCSYKFTIVPWSANESKIEISKITSLIDIFGYKIQHPTVRLKTQYILPSIVVHGNIKGWIYYSINRRFYKTRDNFESNKKVCTLPFRPGKQRMIVTPFGYFMRGKEGVYYSNNLDTWKLSLKTIHPAWLLDNMDSWYDKANQKTYIYVSEYSMIIGADHKLYKGTIDRSKKPKWETIVTVISEAKLKQDRRTFLKAARHIHLVKTDPYSGHVWFGTGDENNESILKRSTDNGKTFQMIGMGSQEFRTLGIWFTKNYVYWNMDTGAPDQKIFRVRKDQIEDNVPLTPILKTGKTKIGIDYIVSSENAGNYFPVNQGEKFTETVERSLSRERHVVAVTDPEFDKKELVANLANGSHWSVFDVKAPTGETVTLVSTTSEGFHRHKTRDNLGRIFGLHENESGFVTVTELLSVAPYEPKKERARLEGIAQADDGTIYFQSFHSHFGGSVVSGVLRWNSYEKIEPKASDL